jgi:hypothetical protein
MKSYLRKFLETNKQKAFMEFDNTKNNNIDAFKRAKMTISLDVLYHFVEQHVYESYLSTLFGMSKKYVVIYASDNENIKTYSAHVLIRSFTGYIKEHFKDFELVEIIKNRYHSEDSAETGTSEWSWSDFFIYKKIV